MSDTMTIKTGSPQQKIPSKNRGEPDSSVAPARCTSVNQINSSQLLVKSSYAQQSSTASGSAAQSFPILPPPSDPPTLEDIHQLQAVIQTILNQSNDSQTKLRQGLRQEISARHVADLVQAK